jgi:predicted lactoylglutathione lyase
MSSLNSIVLEVEDTAAAEIFYKALGVGEFVEVRHSSEATSGFRGFTVSLVCSQPGNVDAFVNAALAAGGSAV